MFPALEPTNAGKSLPGERQRPASVAPNLPFVGRAAVIKELDSALERAVAGAGGVILIGGEPGIGKTRLCHELARRAGERGMRTLWGGCWEHEGAPAFWPFTQIMRSAAREFGGASETPGVIEPLAPELHPGARDMEPTAAAERRFAVLDRVAMWLRDASARTPLMLVLDDLQWADAASLQLLRFLQADIAGQALLVVCTYRDVELDAAHPHAALFAELTAKSHAIGLRGLTVEEVQELASHAQGPSSAQHAAELLHARTGGNPLFVRELLRMDAAEPGRTGGKLPPGLRQVLERRLQQRSAACRSLLAAASVLGLDFSLTLLGGVLEPGTDTRATQQLLREAAAARLLEQQGDRYAFVHALVRDACHATLSVAQSQTLHRRAAEAICQLHAHELDSRRAQLAFHYQRAGAPVDLERALTQLELAGRYALRVFAHGAAATHFRAAIELLERIDRGAIGRQAALWLELGSAEMSAGMSERGRDALKRAATLSAQIGDGNTLARAALSFGVPLAVATADADEIELLTAADRTLPPEDSPLRAHLLARLSTALLFTSSSERCGALSDAALAMARRLGEPATLARVLAVRHQTRPDGGMADERLAIIDEAIGLCEATQDARLALELRGMRLGELLELGALPRYQLELAEYEQEVSAKGHVGLSWHVQLHRATLAMLDGRLDDSERLAAEGLALGRRYQQPGIDLLHASIVMMLRFLQNRSAELLDTLGALVQRFPALAVYRAALAASAAEAGKLELCRVHLDYLATDGFARLPHDYQRIACMVLASGACHHLGDAERADALYALLLPHRRFNARVTRHGTSTLGSCEHFLGMLALTAGRSDEAVAHLTAAVEANRRIGFVAMQANSQRLLGTALLARNQRGDAALAQHQLQRARALAGDFGLGFLFETRVAQPEPLASPTDRGVLRLEGECWLLQFQDAQLRLRDSAGLHLLARLLADPGREYPALELRGCDGTVRTGDAGPVLDEHAIAEYRARRAELGRQLSQAEAWADAARTADIRDEIAALEQELGAALGLGGKRRRAASSLERARVTVTKSLRGIVQKIARQHPLLGDHLERSVRTGHVCVYRPDPSRPVAWAVQTA